MYKRPAIRPRRNIESGELPPSSVMSVRPPIPQWLQNKKVKYNRTLNGGNKLFYHDNFRTFMRHYVRVSRGENVRNGQILPPVPIPRNVRLPTPVPRPFVPMVPASPSRNKNKNNAKYVKSMVTKIIHKLTEPNRRNKANREYISRLVGGIVSKLKKQNKNNKPKRNNNTTRRVTKNSIPSSKVNIRELPHSVLNNKRFTNMWLNIWPTLERLPGENVYGVQNRARNIAKKEIIKRLNAGLPAFSTGEDVFVQFKPNTTMKNKVIRALMAQGMTKKEAEIQELFMNNNNVRNLLRRKSPNRRQSPRQYNTGGKKYLSPPKLPKIIVAETEDEVKALPFTHKQVNTARVQRVVLPNVPSMRYTARPASSVAPKAKSKNTKVRSRILKKLK